MIGFYWMLPTLASLGSASLGNGLWVQFLVTARIGEVAYHLDLKGRFTRVHPVFHVSLLRRFVAGGNGVEPPEPIEVEDT